MDMDVVKNKTFKKITVAVSKKKILTAAIKNKKNVVVDQNQNVAVVVLKKEDNFNC